MNYEMSVGCVNNNHKEKTMKNGLRLSFITAAALSAASIASVGCTDSSSDALQAPEELRGGR